MAEPTTWNRTVFCDTDHDWTLRLVDDEGDALVPTSARAVLSANYGDPAPWLDISSEAVSGPRITIEAVTGWVHIIIPAADTAADIWRKRRNGVWDLNVVQNDKKQRWVMGQLRVSPEVAP